MAGFRTHITTSTALGVGYGAAGCLFLDMPVETCLVAGGFCSVGGMLPDLDSDNSVPVREMTAFAAAVTPMLMIERFQQLGMSRELMAVTAMIIYLVMRFGVFKLFKKYTKHRGMWHSIPACATVGILLFMACSGSELYPRVFKACGVVLGFLSHLVLDEIWSIQVKGAKVKVKRSFGTALKLWGKSSWGNFSVYAKLIAVVVLASGDEMLMGNFRDRVPGSNQPRLADQWYQDITGELPEDTQFR